MKTVKMRFIGAAVAFVLAGTGLYSLPSFSAYADEQAPVVVSLGDSFSSGEGITPFYGQDSANKYENHDWLAHRSQGSWPGRLQFTRGGETVTLSEEKGQSWYFVADSGAKLAQLTSIHTKKPTKKTGTNTCEAVGGEDGIKLPSQLSVFDDNNLTGKVDYVTITLGGNDVGFSEVLTAAATNPTGLQATLDKQWAKWDSEIKPNMIASYKSIREKAGPGAHIIVAGYPLLFNPEGGKVSMGFFSTTISAETAGVINDNVQRLNGEIEAVVNGLRTEGDTKFHFVSVEEAFSGHEAYTATPYINPVMTLQEQDVKQCDTANPFYSTMTPSSYSLHPNSDGAAAYAGAVQKLVNELEKRYTVTFDANAEDATGSTAVVRGEYGSTVMLPANGFAREGFTFTGWNTEEYGTGDTYADGAEFVIPADNVVLFAQWTKNTSPSPSESPSVTPSPSVSPSSSASPSVSPSPTKTPSVKPSSPIPTKTPSMKPSPTKTQSVKPTTPAPTKTQSVKPTPTKAPSVKPTTPVVDKCSVVDPAKSQKVYRLYNRSSGEHLFTTDEKEYDTLPLYGWKKEGVAWIGATAQSSSVGVYRLYNPRLGDHHYTKDESEAKQLVAKYGWRYDNGGAPVFYSDECERVPVYRQYNSGLKIGQHHYTADKTEWDALAAKHGWKKEGIGWHAVSWQ